MVSTGLLLTNAARSKQSKKLNRCDSEIACRWRCGLVFRLVVLQVKAYLDRSDLVPGVVYSEEINRLITLRR
jgi:hypothetical protein